MTPKSETPAMFFGWGAPSSDGSPSLRSSVAASVLYLPKANERAMGKGKIAQEKRGRRKGGNGPGGMDNGDRGGQEEKRERNEEKVEKEAAGRKGVRDNAGVEVTTVIVTKKSLAAAQDDTRTHT